MLTIKRATERDSKIIAEIFTGLYTEELIKEEKIKNNIINVEREYYISFIGKKPVGVICLRFYGKQCELVGISVTEKRKGYGYKLLKFAEKLARDKGCKKIWCYSLELHGAQDFYKKYGWKEVDYVIDYFPGKNCYKFSKKLDSF
ncbi:MAG: GNAT family N-acetyltransferase [Candidatus Aenigmatarchaeota archaeon]|nr:MAG: GNAT family N-acetyltransferase [Candidatus Aenigmarchaeota archaeon]